MMQGPIRTIKLDRIEPRDAARLPGAWIGGDHDASPPAGTSWLTHGQAAPPSVGAPGVVLGMLGAADADAGTELLAHATRGGRIYALVGPTWGRAPTATRLLSAPQVLVRRLPEVPVSAVHSSGGARLWIGGGFALRLDPQQAEAFRLCFLRLFWHDATEEAWSGGRQLAWRAARERPFDVPEIPSGASVRLAPPSEGFAGDLGGAVVHLAGGVPPEGVPRRLWFPAGPDHHDRLVRMVKAGTEVVWEDRGLPDLRVGSGGGEVRLPGTRHRLHVRLNDAQSAEATRLLEVDGRWHFQAGVPIADPALRRASFWLAGEPAARGLEAEQPIELPDVAATSLRAMPDTSPSTWPEAQPLALTVRYRWAVVPPCLPAGTEEDGLVDRWRKIDEDWNARVARLREALRASEGERGRIGHAFSRLVSAMLGFERTHGNLLARVAELESRRPSVAGPGVAPALFSRLAEAEEQARKLETDLEDAERRAREEEAREKQEAAWHDRVKAARRDLPLRQQALADAQVRRESIAEELRTIEEQSRQADKATQKDLTARQRRLSDDLHRTNQELRRLGSEIPSLERQIAEPFEFHPPSQPTTRPGRAGGRFIPTAATPRTAPPVPDEALPDVGSLRTRKGQRYLVIQTWEEHAAGEQAASRLSARLVAPEHA